MLEGQLLLELQEYIDMHAQVQYALHEPRGIFSQAPLSDINPNELEDFVKRARKPSFSKILFRFIDSKGATDSDIYKRAGIDRRHFSKIRSGPDYRPGKLTVIALALALELNQHQTDQLLSAAGYSLSDSDTFDLIIRFFLEKEIYDIAGINEALDHYKLQLL